MVYRTFGYSYLVCPRLLELDPRHGEHWSKWDPCRRGLPCPKEHRHEEVLLDPEGHLVNDFKWLPGAHPYTLEEHPVCPCGRRLVYADLDDLYDPKHLMEAR